MTPSHTGPRLPLHYWLCACGNRYLTEELSFTVMSDADPRYHDGRARCPQCGGEKFTAAAATGLGSAQAPEMQAREMQVPQESPHR